MILARLALAAAWSRNGIGSGMLKDARVRTLSAAEIAGLPAFVVQAKDDEARAFYQHFDPSHSGPMHLFLLLKDVRAAVGAWVAKAGVTTGRSSPMKAIQPLAPAGDEHPDAAPPAQFCYRSPVG